MAPSPHDHSTRGFTLLELMIGVAIMSLVLYTTATSLRTGSLVTKHTLDSALTAADAGRILHDIALDLRSADKGYLYETTSGTGVVTFSFTTCSGFDELTGAPKYDVSGKQTIIYDPRDGTLTKYMLGGVDEGILLTDQVAADGFSVQQIGSVNTGTVYGNRIRLNLRLVRNAGLDDEVESAASRVVFLRSYLFNSDGIDGSASNLDPAGNNETPDPSDPTLTDYDPLKDPYNTNGDLNYDPYADPVHPIYDPLKDPYNTSGNPDYIAYKDPYHPAYDPTYKEEQPAEEEETINWQQEHPATDNNPESIPPNTISGAHPPQVSWSGDLSNATETFVDSKGDAHEVDLILVRITMRAPEITYTKGNGKNAKTETATATLNVADVAVNLPYHVDSEYSIAFKVPVNGNKEEIVQSGSDRESETIYVDVFGPKIGGFPITLHAKTRQQTVDGQAFEDSTVMVTNHY